MIEFFVPIEPVAQGRPKFRRYANFVGTYDPGKSKAYKKAITEFVQDKGFTPFAKDLPLILTVRFLMSKPKSVKRLHPVVKPDLDNLLKAVKDALKGLAWHDDGQVCRSSESKEYTQSTPGIWVGVRELKE